MKASMKTNLVEKEILEPEGDEAKTRVVFVHQSAELYGSDKVLLTLVGALDRSRYVPIVLLPRTGPLFNRLHEAGIKTHVVPLVVVGRGNMLMTVLKLPFQMWRTLRAIDAVLAKVRVDLVHSNTLAVLSGAVWAWRRGVKHVWHVHEIVESSRYVNKAYAFLLGKLSWRIVCNSEATKSWIIRAMPLLAIKLQVILNAVDTAAIAKHQHPKAGREQMGLAEDDFVVLLVGRISNRKGHELLIKAAELLRERGRDRVRYVFIGDPLQGKEHLRDRLVKRITHSSVQGNVTLMSFRSDIESIWQVCDVAVVPSSEPESFGLVALEAMSARKPVIAAAHGGICEVIIDRETGLLFEPQSAVALADALESLANDKNYRAKLGESGYRRALTHFSIREFVQAFDRLYSTLALSESQMRT